MADLNAIVAWGCILAGVLSGSVFGLFFADESWLGGYGSWRRRLLRLGHIAFFGIAAINLALAVTVHDLNWPTSSMASLTLALANVLMPLVCFLAAWFKPMRWLFPLPVGCVVLGVTFTLYSKVMS